MTSLVCPLCNAGVISSSCESGPASCDACAALVFPQGTGPRVLVVHESEAIAAEIGQVLQQESLCPLHAPEGEAAWKALLAHRPAGMVVDVGLNYPTAFELTDRVRNNEAVRDTKIVLLASVFNNTAYKRRPKSLYGADDYVEQHHIADMLPAKLASLLQLERVGRLADVREVAERIQAAQARSDLHGKERVWVLARAVASDIALYHQQEMEAMKQGEVAEAVVVALAEGRRVLAELAHHEEYPCPDPVGEAFEELVAGRRSGSG